MVTVILFHTLSICNRIVKCRSDDSPEVLVFYCFRDKMQKSHSRLPQSVKTGSKIVSVHFQPKHGYFSSIFGQLLKGHFRSIFLEAF